MAKFEVTYEVEDGYAGKSRPQHFTINENELYNDMDGGDLRNFFQEEMQNDFVQRCYPVSEDEDAFVEWALEILEKEKGDEEEEDEE